MMIQDNPIKRQLPPDNNNARLESATMYFVIHNWLIKEKGSRYFILIILTLECMGGVGAYSWLLNLSKTIDGG
jgi:hypothetical protein